MKCRNCGYINAPDNTCSWNDCNGIIEGSGFKYVSLLSGNEHTFCSSKCRERMETELSLINQFIEKGKQKWQ